MFKTNKQKQGWGKERDGGVRTLVGYKVIREGFF